MEVKAEKVNPYADDERQKADQVRDMFDNIAPAYDFMNRAMTMGIDKLWRRRAVKMIAKAEPRRILDVATGTGDLAIKLANTLPEATITGIDLSEKMIEIGRRKIADRGLSDRIELRPADCLALPFADNTFDCVTVAYGVRNFQHLAQGYSEMLRVLRPGGRLCVIELSTPRSKIVRPLYNFYTGKVIPLVGRMVSKDVSAYSYLPKSIAAVPQYSEMTALMEQCGFSNCTFRSMTLGTCCIYAAYKPQT